MDTKSPTNEIDLLAAPMVEAIHRHELRYACGCTTTCIEAARLPAGELPECAGHHHPLIEQVETTEYKPESPMEREN